MFDPSAGHIQLPKTLPGEGMTESLARCLDNRAAPFFRINTGRKGGGLPDTEWLAIAMNWIKEYLN